MKATLKRILLVEDDHDIQTVAGIVLRSLGGFELEICSSGAEALTRAPEIAPDLILLDVMMPGMDGPTTLKALRKIPGFASKPVVFMTARAQPNEVSRYRDLGVADVIVKPFDPAQLCDLVRAIWRRVAEKPLAGR
jgi:CheY-like chemotaxis protein